MEDYIPVFVANGFYKNRTAFKEEHMVMTWVNGKYPKVDRYWGRTTHPTSQSHSCGYGFQAGNLFAP